MNESVQEILQYIEEADVKFIRLAFCDVYGKQKNVSIMPDEIERAFESGISIDSSAVKGFGGQVHSDLLLFPDATTIAELPWRSDNGRVVRMFCDIKNPDGTPFVKDTRGILKRAVSDAKKAGLKFKFGSEIEFYLFKLDENGNPTKIPYDNAKYMDIAPDDKCENIRREICMTLKQMGINPESSHHEEGPGQNEIDFRYSDPITAADNAITFLAVVKTIAARNGLYADFSPKPLTGHPGNGYHINFSAKSTDGEVQNDLIVSGLLDKIKEASVFFNSVEDSYKRMGKDKAPRYITWAAENRSQLIRVPAATGKYKRAELRSPDPYTNPYLAFALIIYAGIYAKEHNLQLPEPTEKNMFTISEEEALPFERLPKDLKQAKAFASESEFIKNNLPESLIEVYCK